VALLFLISNSMSSLLIPIYKLFIFGSVFRD